MPDTIINHHDYKRHYGIWFGSLLWIAGLVGLAYVLEYTTPFHTEDSLILIYSCTVIGFAFALLAIVFKLLFRQQIVAWGLCNSIALLSFIVCLQYGWSWWFMVGFALSGGLLLILGPYLHFE